MVDTTWLDATVEVELVRRGDVSPTEPVEAANARVETVNPKLNAVIRTRFDKAREEAAGELPDGRFRDVRSAPLIRHHIAPGLAPGARGTRTAGATLPGVASVDLGGVLVTACEHPGRDDPP